MSQVRIPIGWKVNDDPVVRASFLGEGFDWGGMMLYLDRVHEMGVTGKGVSCGVIDTGMFRGHKDLDDQCMSANFTTDKNDQDDVGHGTHVRGIIGMKKNGRGLVGVAPDAKIHVAKTMGGTHGTGTVKMLEEGLYWMIREVKPDWINLSLSISNKSKVISKLLQEAEAVGIGIVAASGNQSKDSVSFPASEPTVLAVGAIDSNEQLAYFSNTGKYLNDLDVVGPGVNIRSTWIDGDYRRSDGTSMAAPHVTGLCMLITQRLRDLNLDDSPANVRMIVNGFAKDLGDPGNDLKYGNGRITSDWFGVDTVEDDVNKCEGKPDDYSQNKGCLSLGLLNLIMSI